MGSHLAAPTLHPPAHPLSDHSVCCTLVLVPGVQGLGLVLFVRVVLFVAKALRNMYDVPPLPTPDAAAEVSPHISCASHDAVTLDQV